MVQAVIQVELLHMIQLYFRQAAEFQAEIQQDDFLILGVCLRDNSHRELHVKRLNSRGSAGFFDVEFLHSISVNSVKS